MFKPSKFISISLMVYSAILLLGVAVNWNLFYVTYYAAQFFFFAFIVVYLNPLWFAFFLVEKMYVALQAKLAHLDKIVEQAKKGDN